MSESDANASPKLVSLEGDDIVIRITPDALKFATEHGPALEMWDYEHSRLRKIEVTDLNAWRDAVIRALQREKENGDTPIHLVLDAAVRYASEQGEEGLSIEGILP